MHPRASCVLLAGPHHGLAEGIRSLLSTAFDTVIMVADETSLYEAAERLHPDLAVVDLVLARGDVRGLVSQLRRISPGLKIVLLTSHDDSAVAHSVDDAGAQGLVAKAKIATDLLVAVDAVLGGERYFPTAGANVVEPTRSPTQGNAS